MKIVKLEAQNIKRLKAVTIEPDGSLIVIGGNNGQGKSSTLDAIEYALGGKSAVCEVPIREGERSAKTVLDLEDIIVTRTFSPTGGTLTVTSKDATEPPLKSPQAVLDALVGRLSFDPLSFATMRDDARLSTLKDVVGLDFSELDQKRQTAFDERTQINREGKALKARFDEAGSFPAAPTDEVSVAGLMAELETAQEHNKANDEIVDSRDRAQISREIASTAVDELEKKLHEAKHCLETTEATLAEKQALLADITRADEQVVRDKIASAETVNSQVRANKQREEIDSGLVAKKTISQCLSDDIAAIDKQKSDAMSGAKFPIEGLSFDENGVLYEGLPFDQASDAKKLRVSVAMGIAMNPKLKVLLIRNGSLLDEDNMRMVAEMAAENDAQVWLERVGKGKECSVIIEDGMVEEEPDAANDIDVKTAEPFAGHADEDEYPDGDGRIDEDDYEQTRQDQADDERGLTS